MFCRLFKFPSLISETGNYCGCMSHGCVVTSSISFFLGGGSSVFQEKSIFKIGLTIFSDPGCLQLVRTIPLCAFIETGEVIDISNLIFRFPKMGTLKMRHKIFFYLIARVENAGHENAA